MASSWLGTRSFGIWNEPAYLWTVGLTHTRGTAEILVHTLRAAARPRTARDVADPEPIRVDMAASDIIHDALQFRPDSDDLYNAELALIDIDGDRVVLIGWDTTSVLVDGHHVPAHTRRIADTFGLIVDLDVVIVAVSAPHDIDRAELALVDVRERLGEYS